MFKSTIQYTFVLLALTTPAMAQQYHNESSCYDTGYYHYNHNNVIVVRQGPIYPGPVSQTDRWRYQKSIREYHEAIAAQNRAEVKRRELEIAELQVRRNELQQSVAQENADRLLARRVVRDQRANDQALQLWKTLQANTVSWPVAFDSPWAMQRISVIVDAVHQRQNQVAPAAEVGIAIDQLEQAIRTQQLSAVRTERTDALKTLASLERLLEMDDPAFFAMR